MEAPETIEEAEQYIGQYFIIPKIPDDRREGFSFPREMDCLVGKELECLGIIDGVGGIVISHKRRGKKFTDDYWLIWKWIELVKDIKGVEDLLHHWE